MNKRPRVCIIIPAYNEASVIGKVIKDTSSVFKKTKLDHTIVVIDDGSTDQTTTVAQKQGASIIRHILNSGAGSATATGLAYAKKHDFDIAVTMDADGQHSPEDVLNGVLEISAKNCDLLIGSRLINSSGMSKTKILGNKGLSIITRLLFGISTTDSQSGLRVFSQKAINQLSWKTNGYEFCSEMLWRAKQLNLQIQEYPIQAIYTDYSKTKGQNNWNAVNIIKSLLSRRITELFQ